MIALGVGVRLACDGSEHPSLPGHPFRSGRRPAFGLPLAPGLLALALGLTACDADTAVDRDASPTPPEAVRLVLTIAPRTGDAPLAVRLEARLEGTAAALEQLRCPSLAWDFGNADVLIAPAEDCRPGQVPGPFTANYTYRTAGSFDASVRMLASTLEPSNRVQVLVRGPTPTPPAIAIAPGPTILIATPAGTRIPHGASATPPPVRTTVLTPAPGTPVSGAAAPTAGTPLYAPTAPPTAAATTPARVVSARVLPADLYYVDEADSVLWRLPDSGEQPQPVQGVPAPVDAYTVSPAGIVASVSAGSLRLAVPSVSERTLAASGASAPLWSRDGRRLAYAADGVWVFELERNLQTRRAPDGEPLAWSPSGDRLLLSRPSGSLATLDLASGALADLPIGAADEAGWMPDRDVAWLAGAGLRLVGFGETVSLLPLLDSASRTSSGYVRPDLRLLVLVDRGDGSRVHVFDLTAPTLASEALGPPLDLPAGGTFAWAPDGRTAVVASVAGLDLLDPATGARVPLVPEPVRDPLWVLAGR